MDFIDFFKKYYKSLQLLKESVSFMNKVPNNKYGDNYELCSRIDNFLKEADGDDIKQI